MSNARQILLSLPGVHVRRLTLREGFFTAGRMFALLDHDHLLLRLPARAGAELVDRAPAWNLVDGAIPMAHPWIRLAVEETDPGDLARLAAAAHETVRLLRRQSGKGRSAARRRRPARR